MPYLETNTSQPCPDEISISNGSTNAAVENVKYTNKKSYYEKNEDKKCLELCPQECEGTFFKYQK